jgi:hypothetical protein
MRIKYVPKMSNSFGTRCYTRDGQLVYDFGQGVVVKLDTTTGVGFTDEDVCPILQEPFQEVELDVLPGKSFVRNRPNLCVATLECGHQFSILGIMYQFAIVNMRCPLCRDGTSARAHIQHIPYAFRKCMGTKRKLVDNLERVEREEADAHIAHILEQEEGDYITPIIHETTSVNLTMYMFTNTSTEDLERSVHYQTFPLLRVHDTLFYLPQEETTDLVEAIQNIGAVFIRMTIHCRSSDGIPTELANTPVMPISFFSMVSESTVFSVPNDTNPMQSTVRFVSGTNLQPTIEWQQW